MLNTKTCKTPALAVPGELLFPPAHIVFFHRLIVAEDPEPHSAALNMALDEALLSVVHEPTLRVYRWEKAAVSFGYFTRFAAVAPHWPEREFVRRMTGGGIVPHGADLTYSLIIPASHPFSQLPPRDSYQRIHAALAPWLAQQQIAATVAAQPATPGSGVCFESPVEFDLLAAGEKIAGAAQRRTRDGLLHQGSVQISRLDASTLPQVFGEECERVSLSAAVLAAAGTLAAAKYGQESWTARV